MLLALRNTDDILNACIIMHHVIIEDEQDIDEIDFNYESNDHILVYINFL
jgi:hypothetical protein